MKKEIGDLQKFTVEEFQEDFDNLQKFTVEEFQEDFDNLMDRVEGGESFVITSEYGNAVMVPCDEETEEWLKIYTEYNTDAP